MKILWFSNTGGSASDYLKIPDASGGWIISLENTIKEKIDLHIAFYYAKYSEPFKYKGVHYYPICNKGWKWRMLKNLLIEHIIDTEDYFRYLDIINKVNPDLIHIHGTENPFGCLVGKTTVPIVISIQGNITLIHHKFFAGIERDKLLRTYFRFRSLRDFPFFVGLKRTYEKFAKMSDREIRNLHNCNYVIGRTDWDKRITRILAPQSKYYYGSEILREGFHQQRWTPNFGEKLIIHSTNGNSPIKGFETICLTLDLLKRIGFNIEWRVAGIKDSDHIVKVVKRSLQDRYPKEGLVLLGYLDGQSLLKNLLNANIYAMTSHIENSPNSLCEAMSLGMPCIASFSGGASSLMTDGVEGILIQDGDPWALAGAILELNSDRNKAIVYGERARMRAIKRHDKNVVTDQYVNIYKDIIESLLK